MKTMLKAMALTGVAAALLSGAAPVAMAQSNAELAERIKALEAMLAELKAEMATEKEAMEDMKVRQANTIERLATVESLAPTGGPWSDSPEGMVGFMVDDVNFKTGGYVKTDFIFSNYSDGDLAANSVGRDLYIPGTIPTGGNDESTDADFHARETRFWFNMDTKIGNHDIGGHIQLDFLTTSDGNERVTNSYAPRMRHAFVTISNTLADGDKWLFGQTWSTFQDVAALPENLDFVGPAESTTFVRQAQVRYSWNGFDIALENPETTVTPNGGGARIVTDDGMIPDIALRYTWKGDFGHVALAGLARQLDFDNAGAQPPGVAATTDDTEFGYGISLSGKLNFAEKSDFRFMANYGDGVGRYVGLNTANGAVIDASGDLEAIELYSGFASVRHFWTDQWRSNLTFGYLEVDNDVALTGTGVTENAYSMHANLIWQPLKRWWIGAEYLHAQRELESGADGDMDRFQVSSKFSF